jgi:hypothetical protein
VLATESWRKPATRFLPVEGVASAPKARPVEIVEVALRSGVVVRFEVGADPRYLVELFTAIG